MAKIDYSKIKEDRDDCGDGKYIHHFPEDRMIENIPHKAGWYFIDETWSQFVGPYKTKPLCEDALHRYVINMQG